MHTPMGLRKETVVSKKLFQWLKGLTAILLLQVAVSASAQATRTWVSGVGDDVNPCSRTAPCKTFAGAISKTAASGEINVLDPGGYGAVTITKAMTISGDSSMAGILVSGTNGITVNAANTDVVMLRNLVFDGVGTGLTAIRVVQAKAVIVDRATIFGFNTAAVETVSPTLANVTVNNSTIANNAGVGLYAASGSITVENTMVVNNDIAVQVDPGAIIRLVNSSFYNNRTGFFCNGGGTLASAGDNRKGNNVGGVVTPCAPNAAIAIQ